MIDLRQDEKTVAKTLTAFPDSDRTGIYIYYDNYSTKFIKLEVEDDLIYGGKTYKFKNNEIVLKYNDYNNKERVIVFLRDKMQQLQDKSTCNKCGNWMEVTERDSEHYDYEETEDDYGCTSTRDIYSWYVKEQCTGCGNTETYSGIG